MVSSLYLFFEIYIILDCIFSLQFIRQLPAASNDAALISWAIPSKEQGMMSNLWGTVGRNERIVHSKLVSLRELTHNNNFHALNFSTSVANLNNQWLRQLLASLHPS